MIKKTKRREEVKTATREMGKIHHPINLKNGALQTADIMEERFNEQFEIIYERAKEANLSKPSIDRIEKAQRAFEAIVCYMKYFFTMYKAFVEGLCLCIDQEKFFNEVVFPLSYLKMIWSRLPKREKEALKKLREDLEIKLSAAPYAEELKKELIEKDRECAEKFQRSSSCVEGRNGALSLYHHRFHRLSIRGIKALTVVHNFHIRRFDKTTAAQRFFCSEHENLFESLVMNVHIPEWPQQQYHDLNKRLFGWKKRLTA